MEFINIPAWSAREVVEWLKGLDDSLHQYERRFLSQQITGQQLLQFSSHYFDKLNISKVGHQQLVKDAIQHLCHLHFNLTSENLQSVALNLGVKAGELGSHLRDCISRDDSNHCRNWFRSEQVLSRIVETVTAAKLIISWLDRPPFKNIKDFQVVREDILQYALALTQEANLKKISETSQEIREICDKLVKKATDPLIIQTAFIEIVTLKRKKPDEELGLELRTNALDGTHCIIAANTATPGGRKINFGDEVLQVNYQTVVGWDHKKVIQALIANPTEVALTLKKRPRNLNQAGQLLRPSRHQIQAGGLSSLPRRKHPGNTLHPPSTKDDLYLKTLETQQESEKTPPVLQKQPSHSDSEPLEPENKLLRLRRCPTMGEAVLRRPSPKKAKEAAGEGRPRSLPLDTLELDVSTEDLRHWLEKQANKSEPHGKSAEQLSPRDPERKKKTVRILDLNGNTFRTGESVKNKLGPSDGTAEISLKIPEKAMMANNTASHRKGKHVTMPGVERSDSDVSKGHLGKEHSNNLGGNSADNPGHAVVRRKDLSRVSDRGSYDSKCSSGSSSDGFIYWEESLEELNAGFHERAVDVPEDFQAPERVRPKYKVNPDYVDKSGVVRRPKEKRSRRKPRLSRRITCVDLGSGECEGWLVKRNENKFPRQWVHMLFKLKEFVLYYYKSKDAAKAKGLICLPGYRVQRHDKKDWGIKISHAGLNKTIYLAAEKESDWKKWMEHLQLASILYTEKDKQKDKRKSQILPEDINILKTVTEDFGGYHSESEDEESVALDDPDNQPDETLKDVISNTFARRSLRRKSTRNVHTIYQMQIEYHPNKILNEKLAKKHSLSRTMEAKRKDVDELDKLLAQKITKSTFQTWQHDHPNLLQEIHKSRAPSERRDYSSDEEGSITSNRSDPETATGGSPLRSRTSLDSASLGSSPKSKSSDHRVSANTSPSKQKESGDQRGSPLRVSTPVKGGASKVPPLRTSQSTPVDGEGGSPSQPGESIAGCPIEAPKRSPEPGGHGAELPPGSQGVEVGHHGQLETSLDSGTPGGVSPPHHMGETVAGVPPLTSPGPQRPEEVGIPISSPEVGRVHQGPTGGEPTNSGHGTPEGGSPPRQAGKTARGPPPPTSPRRLPPSKSPKPKKPGPGTPGGDSPSRQVGGSSHSVADGPPLEPQKSTEIDVAAAAPGGDSSPKKVPPKVKERKKKPPVRTRTDSETSETSI